MNQVLPKKPSVVGEHYVHLTPAWLTTLFRLLFVICIIALVAMTYQEWRQMSLGFRVFACVLVPAMSFMVLRKETWQESIEFIAAKNGMYFPYGSFLVSATDHAQKNTWLLVPWENITNFRLAKDTDGSTCVGFDLRVSPEERARFFKNIDCPNDHEPYDKDFISVAYSNNPPSPKKTLGLLKEMKQRHDTSFLQMRRDEATSRT